MILGCELSKDVNWLAKFVLYDPSTFKDDCISCVLVIKNSCFLPYILVSGQF